MTTQATLRRHRTWTRPALLMVFALTPLAAGVVRYGVGTVATDAFELAVAARPAALALHIAGAVLFMALGALQLGPGLRQRWPGLHRRVGYVAWTAGMVMGLSGLWLQLAFPWADGAGWAAQIVRAVMALLLTWWLVAGLAAIRARNIPRHRANMLRAYVVGVGATFNGVLMGIWVAAGFELSPNAFAGLMALGWAILLAGIECRVLRRGPGPALPATA